jgi:outer membrane immunogenic protein
MKKLLLASVGFAVLLSGSATAADLARPVYKAAPPVEAAYNWTGFYIGAHAGYGIANPEGVWDSQGAVHQWSRNDLRGGLWGVQVGFNVQQGMFVWGAEADYSWARWSKDVIDEEDDLQGARLRDFGTARARAGIAVQNWLFYGTAGFAWANARASTENGTNPDLTLNAVGIAYGAGVEVGFGAGWSLKGEYLHLAFGQSKDFPTTFSDQDVGDHFKLRDIDLIRVGLNYRFGSWGGPVMAKY